MRIFYVSHTHPEKGTILDNAGGMQRVSRQLIEAWQLQPDIHLHTETVNVAGRGWIAVKTIAFLLKLLIRLPAKAKAFDADVILFSSMVTASLAPFIRKRLSIPMGSIVHGRDVTLGVGIYQKFVPRIFAAVDGVIAVSQATLSECVKRGLAPEKGAPLGNGIDLNTLGTFPEKEFSRDQLQQKFGIPSGDKKMLLTVGRMVKRKGHAWFIREVLPKVNQEVAYVIIGNGPELEDVKEAARESPQHGNIFLLGRQPDRILKQAYAAADLFVMPNIPVKDDMEGFGIVLLEANMAQTPAIASDLEGIKDVVAPGENGHKIPPLNAREFAQNINEVLEGDLEHFGAQGRKYVKSRFAWSSVANSYAAFLETVINRGPVQNRKKT